MKLGRRVTRLPGSFGTKLVGKSLAGGLSWVDEFPDASQLNSAVQYKNQIGNCLNRTTCAYAAGFPGSLRKPDYSIQETNEFLNGMAQRRLAQHLPGPEC